MLAEGVAPPVSRSPGFSNPAAKPLTSPVEGLRGSSDVIARCYVELAVLAELNRPAHMVGVVLIVQPKDGSLHERLAVGRDLHVYRVRQAIYDWLVDETRRQGRGPRTGPIDGTSKVPTEASNATAIAANRRLDFLIRSPRLSLVGPGPTSSRTLFTPVV